MKRSRLKSDPEKTREWQRRSRRKLPQQSAKRKAQNAVRRDVTEQVFERDGYVCRLASKPETGPCFGPLTPHHLKKKSAGGADSLANQVTLCAQHNSWVEDWPVKARELGMVVRSWE